MINNIFSVIQKNKNINCFIEINKNIIDLTKFNDLTKMEQYDIITRELQINKNLMFVPHTILEEIIFPPLYTILDENYINWLFSQNSIEYKIFQYLYKHNINEYIKNDPKLELFFERKPGEPPLSNMTVKKAKKAKSKYKAFLTKEYIIEYDEIKFLIENFLIEFSDLSIYIILKIINDIKALQDSQKKLLIFEMIKILQNQHQIFKILSPFQLKIILKFLSILELKKVLNFDKVTGWNRIKIILAIVPCVSEMAEINKHSEMIIDEIDQMEQTNVFFQIFLSINWPITNLSNKLSIRIRSLTKKGEKYIFDKMKKTKMSVPLNIIHNKKDEKKLIDANFQMREKGNVVLSEFIEENGLLKNAVDSYKKGDNILLSLFPPTITNSLFYEDEITKIFDEKNASKDQMWQKIVTAFQEKEYMKHIDNAHNRIGRKIFLKIYSIFLFNIFSIVPMVVEPKTIQYILSEIRLILSDNDKAPSIEGLIKPESITWRYISDNFRLILDILCTQNNILIKSKDAEREKLTSSLEKLFSKNIISLEEYSFIYAIFLSPSFPWLNIRNNLAHSEKTEDSFTNVSFSNSWSYIPILAIELLSNKIKNE